MAIIEASRATPEKAAPRPAAIPATCVPCSHPLTKHGNADPKDTLLEAPPGHNEVVPNETLVVEKHVSDTTLPARNGWFLSTPESRTATDQPAPATPAPQAVLAPINGEL